MTSRATQVLCLVVLLAVFCLPGIAQGQATVTTDKPDYAPGEVVTVIGTGFAPGETVQIVINCNHAPVTFSSVADSSANFTNNQFVVRDEDLNQTLTVTATGQTSGRTAQTTFTDAELITAELIGAPNDVTIVQGDPPVAFNISISANQGSGDNKLSSLITAGNPATARVSTTYTFVNGVLQPPSTFSAQFPFFASGSGCVPAGPGFNNCIVTWINAPNLYSAAAQVSANSTTLANNYPIFLSPGPGTVVITNPNVSGAKLADNAATVINVHVRLRTPTNLTANAISQTQVSLNWTDNSTGEQGFRIFRSPSGIGGTFVVIATLPPGTTNFTDTPGCGQTSFYQVQAIHNIGILNSEISNTANATTGACCTAPSVTNPPTNQTICAGSPAGFSVTATGTAPLSYQWRKNTVDIGGATGTSFNIASANTGDSGSYDVVVTNSCGSATSTAATLTVNANPTVNIGGPAEVCQNAPATLTANASGGAPAYNYLWNTTETTQSISPGTGTPGTSNFSVTVTDGNGCKGSANANLVVNPNPTVTISGPDEICQGGTATFTANPAGGTPGYTFSWSTGSTSATINPGTAGAYSVTVTDSKTCTAQATKSLVVNPNPSVSITGAPAGAILVGTSVSLGTSVSGGTPGYSFNWTRNPNSFSSSNASISDTPGLGNNTYSVTVTDSKTCTATDSKTVGVYDFTVSLSPSDRTVLRSCTTSYQVSVALVAGSTTTGLPNVTLGMSGAPSDATTSLLAGSLALQATPNTTTLNVATGATSLGDFNNLTVTGTVTGGSRSGSAKLHIYDYSISLAPNPLVLAQNQVGGYFNVGLNLTPGSTGTPPSSFALSATPPAGVNAALAASSLPLEGSTFLNISPAPPATLLPLGTSNVILTATDGTCARTATAAINVLQLLISGLVRDTNCNAIPNGSDKVFTASSGGLLKLSASNPGGYMYNVSLTNTSGGTSTVAVAIDMPANVANPQNASLLSFLPVGASAFSPWGSRPVHVYTSDPCAPGATDITPAGVTFTALPGPATVSQPLTTNSTIVGTTNSVAMATIQIPAGGTVWLQLHNRYALLGSSGWLANSQTAFIQGYQFRANITFGGQPLSNALTTNITETGKRVTAIGGYAVDSNGSGKGGLKVVVVGTGATCASPNTTTQNVTGFYSVALGAGSYSAVEVHNATCSQVLQTNNISLVQDQFVQVDFPNLSPADPVIEGIVGTKSGGVGGVTVELSNASKRVLAATTTNASGYYVFRFAAPGAYTVTIKPPAGYSASTPSQSLFVHMFDVVRLDFMLTK